MGLSASALIIPPAFYLTHKLLYSNNEDKQNPLQQHAVDHLAAGWIGGVASTPLAFLAETIKVNGLSINLTLYSQMQRRNALLGLGFGAAWFAVGQMALKISEIKSKRL